MQKIKLLLSAVFICSACLSLKAQSPELNESMERGAELYSNFCLNCHLSEGEGASGVFPPLAKSDYLLTKRHESIQAVKYGISGGITVNGVAYNSAMAPMGLSDKEVADVMNYILNSWGNEDGEIVTEAEVSKIQP